MKALTRLILFGIGLSLALLALHGCMAPVAPFVVTVEPTRVRPGDEITITASGRTGGTYFYQPTGKEAVASTQSTFVATVDRWPWNCSVLWRDGDNTAMATAQPLLINEIPVAHDLALFPANPSTGSMEWIDLRFLEHGCLNGMPVSYSGIEDPDYTKSGYNMENDDFTYHVDVYDAGGNRETIYKPDRSVLGEDEFTESPYFVWFPDWKGSIPPFPFLPKTEITGVILPACDPGPIPSPPPSSQTASKRIEVSVKEFGSARRFVYLVTTAITGCGG